MAKEGNIFKKLLLTMLGVVFAIYLLEPIVAAIAGVNTSNWGDGEIAMLGLAKLGVIIGVVYFIFKGYFFD